MEYTLVDTKRGLSLHRIGMDEILYYIEVHDPNVENQQYYIIDHEKNKTSAFYYDLHDNITQVRINNSLRFKK